MAQKTIVVIPARMASSRFPGKPLEKILGLPMVEHVRRRAQLAEGMDEVVVATCDQEIMDVVIRAGGKAVMTSDKHERSSERVAEAMLSLEGDVVVVAQGDEPLLTPGALSQVAEPLLRNKEVTSVSLLSPIEGAEDYTNPNIVKAACNQQGYILYYTRAAIPFFQHPGACPIYRETGIRAFRKDFLLVYVELPETPFERVESVDMLRLLEHGHKVFGVPSEYETIGVDHPEDVPKVEEILRADRAQKAFYDQIMMESV